MKFKLSLTIIIICAILFASNLSADCIGALAVPGTDDSNESCRSKQQESIKSVTNTPPSQSEGQINQGPGSGNKSTNFYVNSPPPSNASEKAESSSRNNLIPTKHQLRLELAGFIKPDDTRFNRGGIPEGFFPNGMGLAYEYYWNKTVFTGFLYQKRHVSKGKSFDPISYRDASGDVHNIAYPGAMKRMDVTHYIPYIGFNAQIFDRWHMGGRLGVGRVEAHTEYDESQIKSGGNTYSQNMSIMYDIFVEYWIRGVKFGAFYRNVDAEHETSNYLEYVNMGMDEFGISIQITLESFGKI